MRYISIVLCFLVIFSMFSGCTKISSDFSSDESNVDTLDESSSTTPFSETEAAETTPIAESEPVPKIPVSKYNITPKSFSTSIEAEKGGMSGGVSVSSKEGKFSGDGYVTGFFQSTEASVTFNVELPTSQHYDIKLYIRSDENSRAYLLAGGEKYELLLPPTDEFYVYSLDAVYLEAGEQEIKVSGGFNSFDLDKITISGSSSIYSLDFDIDENPINKNVSAEAKKLYDFLKNSFGKKCITGQYAASEKNVEAKLIHNVTGNYPLMRLSDIGSDYDEVSAASDWSSQGGIVSFMWYWKAPLDNPEVYLSETDFDISRAVTDKDVAMLPMEQIEKLYIEGGISRECLFLLRDIDSVSEKLKTLSDKKIAVLWRPLHEPDSELYWWGKDADAYKWLWQVMYKRQTEYFKLNNLLWVWNGTSAQYYVGEGLCDIASSDSYISTPKQKTYFDNFLLLYKISKGKKLCALTECGSIPDPNLLYRDNSIWSFFGLWYGDYIITATGKLNESNITRERLIAAYNSELSLVLGDYK